MKKIVLILSIFSVVLSSCSSDDNNQTTNDPLAAHFELTINGPGFNDNSININRIGISVTNNRVAITAGDENLVNFFGFYLPFPIETTTYTMVEGSSPNENTVFFSRNQTDTYYTENGSITISEIRNGANGCQIYKGSINVNLSNTNDPTQILNVSGPFEMPTEECDE